MSTTLIEVRPARAADAAAVASTHDEAWRSAYQGIIPGAELEKLINRRGPQWWDSAIRKGSRVSVLVFWALSDNDTATEFYRALGGRMVARSSEKFGPKSLDKVAFAWTN